MWEFLPSRVRLLGSPRPGGWEAQQLRTDFERFRAGLPRPLEAYILSIYGIDLTSSYGGLKVKNPFGKASGQLSLARHQVEKDAEAGLGFVVLKTVIAKDNAGEQSMREWAIPETRMLVERIQGRGGEAGWTVTWKGRGWFDTFEAYLSLFDDALRLGESLEMLIVPSVKYHLPTPGENAWKEDEYTFTTNALLVAWNKHRAETPMPLEKDFSPTLAGSERATQQAKILEWLRKVPGLIHGRVPGKVHVGLKIFNALFEDKFQLEMLEEIHNPHGSDGGADFMIYANRLFDPAKEFEGKAGVAYGGPDLSQRNLAVLENFLDSRPAVPGRHRVMPMSATGDICSGRVAAEYLLRGASTFQMHTIFQLPDSEYAMHAAAKTEKALHGLIFDPENGFLAWVLDLRHRFQWKSEWTVSDMAAWCRDHWDEVVGSLKD
ncbi:MAG TPA: hypothetical protein VKV95_06110 [Terriglobia bacterium]|nr:hypothetical protein [Terriglobia bacterium]